MNQGQVIYCCNKAVYPYQCRGGGKRMYTATSVGGKRMHTPTSVGGGERMYSATSVGGKRMYTATSVGGRGCILLPV